VTETQPAGQASPLPRAALLVVLCAGALRLVLAALLPLFPDETYYWEWSRRLAGGYFDHPYGIALLVKGGTALFGDTAFGVRVLPVLAGVVASLAAAGMANRLAGARAATLAAVVVSVMPLAATGLVLATPDAPLLATSAVTLYAVVRALEHPARASGSTRWWLAAGVALGLAFSSKFTGILIPLGVLAAVALRPGLRARLREPGPWLACIAATVVFGPVLYWNATHDWAAFAFQLQHGLGGAPRGSLLQREGDLLGGQAGLVSPILFVMMAIAVWRAASVRSDAPPDPATSNADRRALLAISALVVFLFFIYSATKKKVEPNWPAPAYLPAAALLAAHAWSTRGDRWLRRGWILGGALSLLVYVHAIVPVLPVPARRDPVARAFGWDELAGRVDARLAAPARGQSLWLASDRYQESSELAFHAAGHPVVFALNLTGRPNQYDLWPQFAEVAQPGDGLVLVLDQRGESHPTIELLAPHFEQVEAGEVVALRRGTGLVTERRIWMLRGWRGSWPAPAS
jgi:4-amino-4-deoxy-L-arabinose transferase-like glycosyltransferase